MDIVEIDPHNPSRHPWEIARYRIVHSFINKELPESKDQWVLDLGCGDGYIDGRLLIDRTDLHIIGIDPGYQKEELDKIAFRIHPERFHLFQNLRDAQQKFPDLSVDLILALDVIEHIKDDKAFLAEIAASSFTRFDPTLIVTVPAYQKLFSSHDVFLRHFRRYTIRSLSKTVMSAGFTPVRSGYFFSSLLPLRFIGKLIERRTSTNKGIGQWKGGKTLTHLISSALMIDFRISRLLGRTRITLPGLSAYCICKKPVS